MTSREPYKIFVVEDTGFIRDRIHGDLKRMGYAVRSEAFAWEALEEIRREIPDLIITDQNMPGMTGWEMVRKLRADPKMKGVKIIGYGDFPDNVEGFDRIFEKGYLDSVYGTVRHMLSRTLRTYLDSLGKFEDREKMRDYFGLGDNFDIDFYGDTEKILPAVRDAFLDSGSDDDLKMKWDLLRKAEKGSDFLGEPRSYELWHFASEDRKVVAFLRYFMENDLRKKSREKLGGLEISGVGLSLHPNIDLDTMKAVVLDLGEFIIRRGLAAKLGGYNDNANAHHIPQNE